MPSEPCHNTEADQRSTHGFISGLAPPWAIAPFDFRPALGDTAFLRPSGITGRAPCGIRSVASSPIYRTLSLPQSGG
jgi:hypothetical protein